MNRKINYCYRNRYGSYIFRIRTPRKIKKLYPCFKREIKKSLCTHYEHEARRISIGYYVKIKALFDTIIQADSGTQKLEQIYGLIEQIMSKDHGAGYTLSLKSDGSFKIKTEGKTSEERAEDHKQAMEALDKLKQSNNLQSPQSVQSRQTSNTTAYNRPPVREATFADLIKDYLRNQEDSAKTNQDTLEQKKGRLNTILRLVGDQPCEELTIENAKQFLRDIKKLPKNPNTKNLKDLSKNKLLELPDDVPRIQNSTIKTYVELFKSVCKYGAELDPDGVGGINYLRYDIAKKLEFSFSKSEYDNYKPFSKEELEAIFNARQVYGNEKGRHQWGNDWCFWMPLLAAFTGARLNELAQMHVTDIKFETDDKSILDIHSYKGEDKGIWFFSINDEQEKSTKTRQSIRRVPIHSKLLEVGFLDFVREERFGTNKHQLFSDLTDKTKSGQPKKGKHGKQVSEWFNSKGGKYSANGFKQQLGINSNEGKVFHSFRHTFAEMLLDSKEEVSVIGGLIGHESTKNSQGSNTTFIYTGKYKLPRLKEAIEKLDYKIDLSHIDFNKFKEMYKKQRREIISKQKREQDRYFL